MNLTNEELTTVKGGSLTLSASLFSSLSSLMNNVFEIGQAAGSAIRRIYSDNVCSV